MALWLVAVCGDRRASMKLSLFHMISISTSRSSHVSFERSGSTWTKFQTQCNLWKRKKTPVSYKLSAASRLNSLFCLCLIPKLSKSMAQLDCCCRLTQAEINGIVASGCVWRPPSLHEIIFIPYDFHLHFLLFICFFWKICSRSYSSKHAASQCETCIIRIENKQWSASYARCSKEKGATETS